MSKAQMTSMAFTAGASIVAMVIYNFAVEPQIKKRLGRADDSQSPHSESDWWNVRLFGK